MASTEDTQTEDRENPMFSCTVHAPYLLGWVG